jgi:hypothetical protein
MPQLSSYTALNQNAEVPLNMRYQSVQSSRVVARIATFLFLLSLRIKHMSGLQWEGDRGASNPPSEIGAQRI